MRIEKIGDCTLYHGDCLEIMPTLQPVDLAVFDPPYKLTPGGNTNGGMRGKFSQKEYDNSGSIVDCSIDWADFMPHAFNALKDNAHAYVMANNRHIQNMLNSAENAGFKFHNMLVWNKGTATANRWYMKNLEFTGFFYKGKARMINDCGSIQLHKVPNVINAKHPTEKPHELMIIYIENSSNIGDIVLDPFMGSGTTGVAASRIGRKFIGIELNEEYFDLACERISRACDQSDLFR